MKKSYFLLYCGALLFATGGHKLSAQCHVNIAREAYNGHAVCELPVMLRLQPGTSMQAVTWYENGSLLQSYSASWTDNATIIGTGAGSGGSQFSGSSGICVDRQGNLYVADKNNHRVQKWAPGAASGVTVAGTGASGSGNDQLNGPADVFVDAGDTIYIADANNHRIQKWAPGAASGVTVAGNGASGSGNNQLNTPAGVFVDAGGNVYVADANNHRVQKWAPGAASGVTVAGNGASGSGNDQLSTPSDVYADAAGNLFIADKGNHRIQKWAPGATAGTMVAGTGASGHGNDQLSGPVAVYVDGPGNLYIGDAGNTRVQFWAPNATAGTMIADLSKESRPSPLISGVALDSTGNLYLSDYNKNRVLEYPVGIADTLLVIAAGDYKAVVTGFNGCLSSDSLYVTALAAAPVTPSGTHTMCQGESITLHTFSGPGLTYQWEQDGTDIPQATDSTYTATAAGVYRVTIHNGPDCALRSEDSLDITVHPLPAPVVTGSQDTLTVTGTYDSYQWSRNGTDIAGATGQVYMPDSSGDYTVTVTDSNGCPGTSAAYPYYALGVSQVAGVPAQVHIYPNPARSLVYIRAPFPVSVSLRSMEGKMIISGDDLRVLDISRLPEGLYLLQVKGNDGQLVKTERLLKSGH